jgi:hypothetical protein
MATVPERPPGAKITDPSASRVDLADPAARAEWLADAWEQAADLRAAGLDATASPGARELGRPAARRIIRQAGRKLADLLTLAGLAPTSAVPSPRRARWPVSGAGEPNAGDDQEGIGALRDAWSDLVCEPNAGARRDALQAAPLSALLLYAIGEPRETVQVEPIVLSVLAALRSTVDGWASGMRERGSVLVPVDDLCMLARRMDVAIEIVRRGGGAS